MRQNLKFKSKSKNFPLGRREGDWGRVPEWGMEGEGGGGGGTGHGGLDCIAQARIS